MSDQIPDIDILIIQKDITYLRRVISGVGEPVEIDFLASKLRERFIRTRKINFAERLIKVYDPANDYNVGDHIFRHFGKVRTSQRRNVEFNDYAEGEVYEKIRQRERDYDLICVEWHDPLLKRQAKFLSNSGAQQYLPVNYGRTPGVVTRYLGPDKSERERDQVIEQYRDNLLRQVRAQLLQSLYEQSEFIAWGPLWYLIDLLEEIDYDQIQKAGAMLEETDGPLATEKLVAELFGLTPDSPRFLHFRFSLNYMMENFFSESFYCLSHFGGGAWTNRAKVPKSFGSRPLRLATAKIPAEMARKEFVLPEERLDAGLRDILLEEEEALANRLDGDALVHVLTYNEFVSGSLNVPDDAARFFPEDTRLVFTGDEEEVAAHPVTYHYESGFIAGLTKLFRELKLVPGAILEIQHGETPTAFRLTYVKSDQKLHYPHIEYDPLIDTVRIQSGTEIEAECEVEPHTFVPAGDIEIIERLRSQMKSDAGLYAVLIKLFRDYRSSFHPITLWRMVNIIRDADMRLVFSALSAYKSFYHIDEERMDEYLLSPTQVGPGSIKRGISANEFLPVEAAQGGAETRFFRPKTYLVNLSEAHWEIARNYSLIPISDETECIEIRRYDRAVVLVDGEIQGAVHVTGSKELLNPVLRAQFKHDSYISSVNVEILGENPCDEIEIYHVPGLGDFVQLEAETFEELLSFYEETEESKGG
jgi:hypothetical protein